VGPNSTKRMDVWCVCVYSVCVVLCLGRGLETSWSPVQGVLPSVKLSRNWEISPMFRSGARSRKKIGWTELRVNLHRTRFSFPLGQKGPMSTYTDTKPVWRQVEYLHRDPASRKRRRNGTKKAAP
jgi:hypothetical protein